MFKFAWPLPFSCFVSFKSISLSSDCFCCLISFSCICFSFFNLSNLDFCSNDDDDAFVLDDFDFVFLSLLEWPLAALVDAVSSTILSLLPFRTASNLAVDEILFSFSAMSFSMTLYFVHKWRTREIFSY